MMLKPIIQAFQDLVFDYSWRTIGRLILLSAAILLIFLMYEQYSSSILLAKHKKILALISDIQNINACTATQNHPLTQACTNISTQLTELSQYSRPVINNTWTKKFLGGLYPWLILIIIVLVSGQKAKDNSNAGTFMMLIFGLMSGWAGTMIPYQSDWITLIIYPWSFLLLAVLSVNLWAKKQKEKETKTSHT